MSGTLSVMTLAIGIAASCGCTWTDDSGTSDEALFLRKASDAASSNLESSQALFGAKAEAIQSIWTLYNECNTADWDGYGGMPMSLDAAHYAVKFIRALPSDVRIPEFAADPDGAISLDWAVSRNRTLSLSIGPSERLSYAWLDGAERGYAVGVFANGIIPERVLATIRGIQNSVRPSVRFA